LIITVGAFFSALRNADRGPVSIFAARLHAES
jgi:hypothetical protein